MAVRSLTFISGKWQRWSGRGSGFWWRMGRRNEWPSAATKEVCGNRTRMLKEVEWSKTACFTPPSLHSSSTPTPNPLDGHVCKGGGAHQPLQMAVPQNGGGWGKKKRGGGDEANHYAYKSCTERCPKWAFKTCALYVCAHEGHQATVISGGGGGSFRRLLITLFYRLNPHAINTINVIQKIRPASFTARCSSIYIHTASL